MFTSVAVLSRCNAWAVGRYASPNGSQTLIEHWNGSAWKQVASPNPGSNSNELHGVAAVSAGNIWAVGSYSTFTSADQTLVLHWNGTAWKQVASPNPAGSANGNSLHAVTAVSASNAWAVGSYYSVTAQATQTLILHWNGTAWKRVASPNPGSGFNDLYGVTAVSASNAWAVGDNSNGKTLALHWNGTAWKHVTSPNPGDPTELSGVAAVSASNAWAVGNYWNADGSQTLILHWNGTAWKHVTSPNPGGSNRDHLSGVTAITASNAWAVGTYYDSSGTGQTLVLHWNGTAWRHVASSNPGGPGTSNGLASVAASSATNIWAVGLYSAGDPDSDPNYTEGAIAIHCC
jgi:hypothetical protein